MKKAVDWYNSIMFSLAREHHSIGTKLSENTDGWNIRDMVSEVQYTIDLYEDPGCRYWDAAHDETQPRENGVGVWYKEWRNIIARMKRFVAQYKDEALTMECVSSHHSKYD